MFRCRFEIWMNYREDDDNLEKIKKHFEELLKTLQSSEINVQNMKFFNISKKPILANTQADKKPELEKTQSENKNNWTFPMIYVSKFAFTFFSPDLLGLLYQWNLPFKHISALFKLVFSFSSHILFNLFHKVLSLFLYCPFSTEGHRLAPRSWLSFWPPNSDCFFQFNYFITAASILFFFHYHFS